MKKKYEELTFSDDFMFCKVLQNNPELCHELLELILGTQVGDLVTVDKQYPIEITSDRRGVRFDVYAKDDSSVIYDIEMQNALKDNLSKRTRYIQGLIDLDQLERGAHFSELSRSYVIFICDFNLQPEVGRHKYSFRNLCTEEQEIELDDETEKVFLCTVGSKDDISFDIKKLLDYVAGNAPKSDFTKKLNEAVADARMNPIWRKEFMDLQDYIDEAREEGRAEERENAMREAERADAEKSRADAEKSRADAMEKELAEYKSRFGELSDLDV